VKWAVSPLFVKQIKFILKFQLKRSSHRHSNHAFAICATSLALWNANILEPSRERENENGNFECEVKIAVDQIKGK